MEKKYWLSPEGETVTGPYTGHYSAAVAVLFREGLKNIDYDEAYLLLFNRGYIRVVEDEKRLQIEAPHALTAAQSTLLSRKSSEGLIIELNDPDFCRLKSSME